MKNKGTEDLKRLLKIVENMTIEEYENLYNEAKQHNFKERVVLDVNIFGGKYGLRK